MSLVYALGKLSLLGCRLSHHGNSTEWKQEADTFIADLVAGRTDEALDLMEPEFSKSIGGPVGFESAVEKAFSYLRAAAR